MVMDTPPASYKLDELAAAAGIGARTVRYYVQRGLLPAPVFRGRDTTYGADHLLRLRAIRTLQARFVSLDAMEAELDACTPADLAALAAGHLAPVAPQAPAPQSPQTQAPQSPQAPAPPQDSAPDAGRAWQRWPLAPGLELHLAAEATPQVRELARLLRQAAANTVSESAAAPTALAQAEPLPQADPFTQADQGEPHA